MQIQLTSEITWPYSTTSVISGLFYTSYSFYIDITMTYTHDYATRMPTREKKKLSHGITSMEYGLIFHVTRIGTLRVSGITSVEYGQICVSGNTIVRI